MPDEDVVDNMGYDMLEAMERINYNICDDSDYFCGGNMKWIMKINFYLMSLKKILDIIYIYIWIFESTNGAKNLVKVNNIFIYQRMVEIGGYSQQK